VLSGLYVPPGAIITVSEYPKMSKPGTAGKRKHATLALPLFFIRR